MDEWSDGLQRVQWDRPLFPLVHDRCSSVTGQFVFREGTSCNGVLTPEELMVIFPDDHAGPTAWTEEVFVKKQRGSDATAPKHQRDHQ